MIEWLRLTPQILFAVVLTILPGLPAAWLLGAKGLRLVAYAVLSSFGVIGVASMLAPYLGFRWSLIPVAIVSLGLAIIALICRPFLAKARRKFVVENPVNFKPYGFLLPLLVSVLIIAVNVATGIIHPEFPSQTYDAIFHLNSLQYILDQGNASSLAMTLTTPGVATNFYPALWHAYTTLIAMWTGDVVIAANISSVVISAVVWSVSAFFFVSTFLKPTKQLNWITAVAVSSLAAFPYLLVQFGVLYPNLLGYALMPIVWALIIELFGKSRQKVSGVFELILVIGFGSIALGLAHPNTIFTTAIMLFPYVVYAWWDVMVKLPKKPLLQLGWVAGLAAVVIAGVLIWREFRLPNHWSGSQTILQTIGEVTTLGFKSGHPQIVLAVFLWVAAVLLWRQKNSVLLAWSGSLLVAIGLYILVAGTTNNIVRNFIGGMWYGDSYRIVSFLVISVTPIVVYGGVRALEWSTSFISDKLKLSDGSGLFRALPAALLVAMLAITQVIPMQKAREDLAEEYSLYLDTAEIVNADEFKLFKYIDENLPEDAVFIGNPWTGTGMVYAITARGSIFTHAGGSYPQLDMQVAGSLADSGPSICPALAELGVTHVLDFGDEYIMSDSYLSEGMRNQIAKFSGLDNLKNSKILQLEKRYGDAKLFEVIGCN